MLYYKQEASCMFNVSKWSCKTIYLRGELKKAKLYTLEVEWAGPNHQPCLQSWQTGMELEQDSRAIKSIPDIGIQRSFITIRLATNDGMNCVLQEI